ncbi:MAG: rRNA pseudouridine synthase [Pseudomonadaceae bacterium]|nr:rRNA pseudouridine synthase [Pseudomonadaceae bacterium]
MQERIAKYLSACGVASRREAERMIEEGRVAVNNEVLTTPAHLVGDNDLVTVDGMLAEKPKRTRVFVYYKPTGVIVSSKDEKGRKTLNKALPDGMPRVVPVGRLDINSEGLLLLTTNGDLAQWLMRPSGAGYERHYKVRVYGALEEWQLAKIRRGMTVDGVKYAGAKITHTGGKGRNVWYNVTLSEGKNREIRKLFGAFGIMVSRLLRTDYGPFSLGNLQPGMVSELKPFEVKQLMGLFEAATVQTKDV